MSVGAITHALESLDRRWNRLVPPLRERDPAVRPAFPWRRHAVFAATIAGFAGLDASRRSLDEALAKIHLPEERGFGVNELHNGAETVREALGTWARGSDHFADILRITGRQVAVVQTLVELVLAPVSALVLFGTLRFLRNQLDAASPEQIERPEPHEAVLTVASLAVVAYFVLGVFNQLGELLILGLNGPGGPTAWLVELGSLVRRAALISILVPVATTAWLLARNVWHPFARVRRAGSAYRVLIVVGVLHFALLQLSIPAEQSRDAIRLWPERGWLTLWGVLMTSAFALAQAVLALRLGVLRRSGGRVLATRPTLLLAFVGIVIAAVGFIGRHFLDLGGGVTALGLLVSAIGLLSLPICWFAGDHLAARELVPPGADTQVLLPALLAMAPLVALEMAVLRAGLADLIAGTTARWLVVVAVMVFGLAVFAYLAARRYGEWATEAARSEEHTSARGRAYVAVVVGLGVTAFIVAVWVVVNPWDHGRSLGVHGILGTFLVLVSVTFGSIGYLLEGRAIPAAFDFLGLRRLPLVSALLAWAVIGNYLQQGEYHEIRILSDQPADAVRSVGTRSAFARWVSQNAPGTAPVGPVAPDETRTVPGVPMLFITAAGGGIRAATFTASVVDCLFTTGDPTSCANDDDSAAGDRWTTIFAASGASGGSVGLASVAAQRTLDRQDPSWVRDRLGTDLLSPALAWHLFVEAPNALLGFDPDLERAEVLERTWERRFDDPERAINPTTEPFLASLGSTGWPGPMLYLNGTNLTDGCRVTVSPARTSSAASGSEPAPPGATLIDDCRRRRLDDPAGTLDQTVARSLSDYLCVDEDLTLSTAAFLSARFPLVSPTGVVPAIADRRPECSDRAGRWALSIGDGGYRDNTGAAAIADLWAVLEPMVVDFNRTHERCIVPLLVEIDNGHRNRGSTTPAAPGSQLLAPLDGALGVFASRDAGPIESLAADFSRALAPGMTTTLSGSAEVPDTARFVRLSLYDHPGVLAPLGWSLSDAAVRDLTGQLDTVDENIAATQLVRRWMQPSAFSCSLTG